MFSACFFNWEKNSSHWVKQNAPHGAVTNLVQVTSLFLWDLRGRQKQPFPKKAYHPGEKTFLPNFSHFIECGKFLWRCKKHFDTHWGNIRSNLEQRRGSEKHSILKEKLSFQWQNYIGPLVVVVSSMKNITKHSIGAHKLFWQLLFNLWDELFRTEKVDRFKFLKKRLSSR